jgi:Fe-S cluster assembly protein SufD
MVALPTRRLEAWRYTDLRPLSEIAFSAPAPIAPPAELPDPGLPRLIFLNGRFDAEHSAPCPFLTGFARVVEASDHPMAQINAEHAQDGLTLAVPDGVDAGALLLISYADAAAPAAFHPRHRITLGRGAQLSLIEIAIGQGEYWQNAVFDIALHEQSGLRHYRLQNESAEAFHLTTLRAKIAQGAAYDGFSLITGARLSRTEFRPTLLGAQARAALHGALLLRGRQHADLTAVVAHDAPACTSRQVVKSVLDEHAHGVFQGRIEVARAAQKTDGYQLSQALLLAPGAEMDVKPELEIFADDVKCSHGATVGALDFEQLFYLRSRGIPEAQARGMLIRAFLADALAPAEHPAARTMFDYAIQSWWDGA